MRPKCLEPWELDAAERKSREARIAKADNARKVAYDAYILACEAAENVSASPASQSEIDAVYAELDVRETAYYEAEKAYDVAGGWD